MEQKIKERLVGLAVLLLFAVIFIPLILDGDQTQIKTTQSLELPVPDSSATHELDFSNGSIRQLQLPEPVKQGSEVSDVKTPQVQQSGNADSITNVNANINDSAKESSNTSEKLSKPSASQAITDSPASSNSGAIQRSATTISDSSGSASGNSTNSGLTTTSELQSQAKTDLQQTNAKEAARVATDPASAWVVQTGSFKARDNAEKEVARLKTKGFPAFLRRYTAPDETILYRVRIGPEKDRARADKLLERLASQGIKGKVLADP